MDYEGNGSGVEARLEIPSLNDDAYAIAREVLETKGINSPNGVAG